MKTSKIEDQAVLELLVNSLSSGLTGFKLQQHL